MSPVGVYTAAPPNVVLCKQCDSPVQTGLYHSEEATHLKMADEQDTREVLFPQWMGADKVGLTIEQKGQGEIFVKEVKDESPAAHSGKVYEGDQIVGATIYFDNMSSEETAELLKTLNRHKVGLKLQNKSPCRSPVGTLSWEGRAGLGGSSSDILLSGDDEDYKRIYTKKIKPRLKSEDLAEGVDVRTERHSSTSSDGCTITTITRRITTYTVDMPGGTSQQIDPSSPEYKIQVLQHEQSEGDSSQIKLPHSTLVSGAHGGIKMGDISLSGPHVTGSSVKHCSIGSYKATDELDGSGKEITINVSDTGLSSGKGKTVMERFGRTEASAGSSDLTGKVTVGLDKDVRNISSPLEAGFKASGMMGGTEFATVKGPVLDTRVSGFSISGDTGDSIGRHSLSQVHKDGSDDKTKFTIDVQRPKEGPNVEVNFNNQNLKDVSQRGFSITGNQEMSAPSFRMKGTNLDTDVKPVSFGLKGSNTIVSLPKADVKITSPDMGIKGQEFHIEGHEGSVTDVKFDAPSITGQRISTPDIDLSLKGQKVKGDVSVPHVEGNVTTSKVEIKGPNFEGVRGDFAVKMPLPGVKSSEVKGPDVDVNIAKSKMEIKAPDMDIKAPELKIGSSERKLVDPNIKVPSVSGPKISVSDVNFNMKGSTLKDDVNVSAPNVEGDVKAPEIEIGGPDLESAGFGFKMPKIRMPSFGIKSSKMEGPDVDTHLPKADIEIKPQGVHIKGPELENEGKIKGTKFKISMPDVDLKGPKLKGDVDVSVPKVEGDIKAPKVEIEGSDIKGPEGGFKMPKVKMPSFGLKGSQVEGPDVNVKIPKANIKVEAPDVDIKAPGFDIEGPEGKIKGPKFEMPTISAPKISMPDVDFNLKGPKMKGDVDMSVPKVEGEIKAPRVEIEGPDIEGPEGGFKMPKIKMPSFGLKGPKVEGPDVDVKIPKADIKVKGPDVDIKAPEVDIERPEGKIKGPKFEMPSISGPKISMPDVDFNLKGPKLKGDVDVSVPKVEGDIKAPKVEIEGPDIEGPEGGFKMPKIKMPSFGLKGPKMEGPDVDVKIPKADIEVKAPDVDIKAPELMKD
ncbi:hypothetical protein QQF64_007744 [Cirrhinus molitorella]|uniref:PDZ domain-containing protein n=1 Tax=Cirrhinus molitorella TaxID=172907 RepID=A0ABR3MEQ5_9TELE